MARRIESYYIRYKEDVPNIRRFALFYNLYEKVLHKDNKWHFFTEGSYDELRFQSKYKRRVNRFLDNNNIVKDYEARESGWVDTQTPVEKYKEYFTEIFHQNSVIALELYKDNVDNTELQKFIDRVVHSFFNMIGLFNDPFTEEIVMASYLIDRAFYTGMTYAYHKMEERE